MGRVKRNNCRLCSKPTMRNDSTTLNNLPKTFAHILEEISGIRFTQADGLHITVCNRCRDFLQAMEHHSSYPGSNKISGAGRKKVRRLMDKGFSAAEAIEKVAAEKRARDLLAGAMGDVGQGVVNAPQKRNVQNVPNVIPQENKRMSGAQRKKMQILVGGGMDHMQARELVLAASNLIVGALQPLMGGNATQGGPNQGGFMPRQPRQRVGQQNIPMKTGVNRQNAPRQNATGQRVPIRGAGPPGGQAQKGVLARKAPQKATNGAVKKPPVQKAQAQNAPPQKAQVKNVPVQRGQAQKPVAATNPQQRRPNNPNQSGGVGKNVNPDKRIGPNVVTRRNERPAPYNNRGGNSQQQQRNQNSAQNGNFNNNNQQSCPVEIGIIPINFPNVMLDNQKLDALKEAITNEIFKIPQGGPAIRFLGTSSQNGWLKVICADQLSYNWLGMLVSRWERAGVRMVEGNDLPHSVYLSFFLPGDFRTPPEILSILERQNNGLNTSNWRILNRETDDSGQRIIVSVDEQTSQALQSRDFTVFLGLGVVEMKASQENPCGGGSFNMQGNNNNNNYRSNSGGGGGGMGNNYQPNRQNNSGGGGGSSYQRQGMGQGYQRGGYQNQRVW